ncbi:MAG TPA: hypothetical protein PKO41_00590 [Dokdonella sp.]|uniref:hypothetical protein n=1 Tax=Dokdonella sp. TaxID=2291710 RepID=UPI0025BA175F|nr:hypothetical protein [Dokdonella sp.]MBX3691594.1 hypothetical protein [Dokdonella sp.]MCW5567700.1 hypothetical protein [Dokdonella sp.]HNR90896.1 hypothetical protein [Dokdonella sp.]
MNAQPAPAPTTAWPIGDDPALSAEVRRELVDSLVARGGVGREQAEAELAARDVAADFERRFAPLGLDRRELPDVLAAQIIGMWSIVHDAAFPSADIARALSRQLASSLPGRAEAVDPRKRQLVGEALIHETVLALEARDAARAAGRRSELKQMAESAQRNMLNRQAINLRKTQLTPQGMRRG